MFYKALFALPCLALSLIAAKAPEVVPPPLPSIMAPAGVAADPANKLTIDLSSGGSVVIQMRPDLAPHHVERVQILVRQGFYNGLQFHRVIPEFMAQSGDPKGDGSGGSSLPDLKAEFTNMPYFRGTVAAARADSVDSANSQFFIMFGPNMGLEKKYTVWGRVISGMDAVDRIAVGEPPEHPTKIVRAYLGDMTAPAVAPTVAVPAPPPAPVPAPAATPSGG
jgi:cyclophilin family peptidyl-prolyl cis-trans isomerase